MGRRLYHTCFTRYMMIMTYLLYHLHNDKANHVLPCALWLCHICFTFYMMCIPYMFYHVHDEYAINVLPCARWLSIHVSPCVWWWLCHTCHLKSLVMITPYLPFEVLGMIMPYLLCQVWLMIMLYFPCCTWLLNTIPGKLCLSDPKGLSSPSVLSWFIFALLPNSEGLMQNIWRHWTSFHNKI